MEEEKRVYIGHFGIRLTNGQLIFYFNNNPDWWMQVDEDNPVIEKAIKMSMKTPFEPDNIIFDKINNLISFEISLKDVPQLLSNGEVIGEIEDIVSVVHPVCPFCGSEPEYCGDNHVYVRCSSEKCFMHGMAVNVSDWRKRFLVSKPDDLFKGERIK